MGDVLITLPGAVPDARAPLPPLSSVAEPVTPEALEDEAVPALADAPGAPPPALPAEPALPAPPPAPAPPPPDPPPWAKHTALHRPATTIKVLVVVAVLFIGRRVFRVEVIRPRRGEIDSRGVIFGYTDGPGCGDAVRRSSAE